MVHHHPRAVNVLLESILPFLEQLVVLCVMRDTILMSKRITAQFAQKVVTPHIQGPVHVPNALQAITPLRLDPQCVKSVQRVLSLQLDQVATLNVQLELTQRKLEALNVLIVQPGDIHQEMDQQAVNCVLQGHTLHQDPLFVSYAMQEVLPARKVVISVSLALPEHIL